MLIKKIWAQEVLDSRGKPTVRAFVQLNNNITAKATVPSGASTGKHEAHELRDKQKRYFGQGVLKAVNNVNKKIAPHLKHKNVFQQKQLDKIMIDLDGTLNKQRLGANAILAVSLAIARAGALAKKLPLYIYLRQIFDLPEKKWSLPRPMMNILNGGKHADNSLVIQEFMIVPQAYKFYKQLQISVEVFYHLKKLLQKKGFLTLVGDEGGFAPNLQNNEQAFKLLVESIKKAGYTPGKQVYCAADLALSEYFQKGKYALNDKTKKHWISPNEVLRTINQWLKKYPILSLEDIFAEDDWQNWQKATHVLSKKVLLVGDDLFVTNQQRLQKGINLKVANAILIKLNQIGTLSETIQTIYLAKQHHYKTIISHRSGETCDTFIADLAVAVQADFIKAGSLSRSERLCKYNRLLEIEAELSNN